MNKNKRFLKFSGNALILLGIYATSISTTASADWTIVGLGTLTGSSSTAADINNFGQVVGNSYTAGCAGSCLTYGYDAFVTGANGTSIMDLGISGVSNTARSINNYGQIVGTYEGFDYNPDGYPFLRTYITGADGVGISDLGTLPGGVSSQPGGINDSGQVAGHSYFPNTFAWHAFITGPNGTGMTDLGTLGGRSSYASAINNSGQVVGGSYTIDNQMHAFITDADGVGMTDLNVGGSFSYANAINNSGQVVGASDGQAFFTDPNGIGTVNIGVLLGGVSQAWDINDSGQVVGNFSDDIFSNHTSAFLYSDGVITNISLLAPVIAAGWTDLHARAINETGQIVGYGSLDGGITVQAFLLSPVPEPQAYAMLLAGLGLLGFMARRRKESAV